MLGVFQQVAKEIGDKPVCELATFDLMFEGIRSALKAGNEDLIRTNSVYNDDELFVLLPQEDRLMRDILMYKRTEKYIRQNTTSQVRALKEFYEDFFDAAPAASEAKALGKEATSRMQAMRERLGELTLQTQRYPFLQQLELVVERLDDILAKPYTWYLTELTREEDAPLDLKDGLIDPLRKFMAPVPSGRSTTTPRPTCTRRSPTSPTSRMIPRARSAPPSTILSASRATGCSS
jgi:hypothetical protein